jgi:hypothetical protein
MMSASVGRARPSTSYVIARQRLAHAITIPPPIAGGLGQAGDDRLAIGDRISGQRELIVAGALALEPAAIGKVERDQLDRRLVARRLVADRRVGDADQRRPEFAAVRAVDQPDQRAAAVADRIVVVRRARSGWRRRRCCRDRTRRSSRPRPCRSAAPASACGGSGCRDRRGRRARPSVARPGQGARRARRRSRRSSPAARHRRDRSPCAP